MFEYPDEWFENLDEPDDEFSWEGRVDYPNGAEIVKPPHNKELIE